MDSTEDIVDSTMCGCDIDPLSGRGHYFQLVVMVALPLIPVTALAVYSSLKLASTLQQFHELQVFKAKFHYASWLGAGSEHVRN